MITGAELVLLGMVGEGHWAGRGTGSCIWQALSRIDCGRLEGGWRQTDLIVMVQGERMVTAGAVVGGWRAGATLERGLRGGISRVR